MKIIVIWLLLGVLGWVIVAALAVGVHAAFSATRMPMAPGEQREIAYRFAQDWADLLDGQAHIGACSPGVCAVKVTGPVPCSIKQLFVWKAAPHTYYSRARGVTCGLRPVP